MLSKEEITEQFKLLQDGICAALENEDAGAKFTEDNWTREEGGGGRTRIVQHGNVIEKGGVLFSAVHGPIPDFLKNESKDVSLSNATFYATGVSIVIHPSNPFVPIIHMNIRYFEILPAGGQGSNGVFWFGGGIDLTPHYVNNEDAAFFHNALKKACDKHHPSYYPEYKKWADDYFFIKHRNETRGIGGIFFDKLMLDKGTSKKELFDFVMEVGNTFAPTYTSLMNKNKSKSFTEANKQWQMLRRGRYVEFNLVYDKGTKFGLETNGRTESILMSLPENAGWLYNYIPAIGSDEENTISVLKKGINWL